MGTKGSMIFKNQVAPDLIILWLGNIGKASTVLIKVGEAILLAFFGGGGLVLLATILQRVSGIKKWESM